MTMLSHVVRGWTSFAVAGIALAAVAVSPARAGTVTILSHDRHITVSAGFPGQSETITAPDAGPFDETLMKTVSDGGFNATATGSLKSAFGQDGFTFSGRTSYATSNDVGGEEHS